MLHLRYLAGFWICFDFRIYQSSEYTRVLNMSALHKVLNKIFRDRCLAVFYICWGHTRLQIKFFVINTWQGSEHASSSENTSVTQGSVENIPSYMFDRFLSIPWALNLIGLEYTWSCICQGSTWFCINFVLKILIILNVLSSEYAKVLNVSEV